MAFLVVQFSFNFLAQVSKI